MSRDEVEVQRVESWEEIMSSLKPPMDTIYEQTSEIRHNMVHLARMGGAPAALRETASCLREILEATKNAQARLVAHASEHRIADTDLATLLGVHRNTVRRWREEYEQWQQNETMTTEEVDKLTQRREK